MFQRPGLHEKSKLLEHLLSSMDQAASYRPPKILELETRIKFDISVYGNLSKSANIGFNLLGIRTLGIEQNKDVEKKLVKQQQNPRRPHYSSGGRGQHEQKATRR